MENKNNIYPLNDLLVTSDEIDKLLDKHKANRGDGPTAEEFLKSGFGFDYSLENNFTDRVNFGVAKLDLRILKLHVRYLIFRMSDEEKEKHSVQIEILNELIKQQD